VGEGTHDSDSIFIIIFQPGETPWWLKIYKRKLQNLFGSGPTLAGPS